jgi:hypothetical protein
VLYLFTRDVQSKYITITVAHFGKRGYICVNPHLAAAI